MASGPEIRTERLLLRRWLPEDRPAFAAINADPRVMEFLGGPITRDRSDAVVDRIEAKFEQQGFGWWAIEAPDTAPFIGFAGLNVPEFEAPFMPAVEIGWRLGVPYWGHGYASEAALGVLGFAFEVLALDGVVAFAAEQNTRSRRVMERIGMTHDPADDFDHPMAYVVGPHRRHVLYRIGRPTKTG